MKNKAVIVIGPSWHSCGSYEAMRRQIECCSALGFETFFLAVSPQGKITENKKRYWQDYLQATTNLGASERAFVARSKPLAYHREFWTHYPPALFRSVAYLATLHTRLLNPPDSLMAFVQQHDVIAILCNHYFNLPIALKLRKKIPGVKIVLETQDIQSYHFQDGGMRRPFRQLPDRLSAMLRDEMKLSRQADEMVHYNEKEAAVFEQHAPNHKHHIVYPTVPRNHSTPAKVVKRDVFDFLIVASANEPNFRSLVWFFDDVWNEELEKKCQLRILGNVAKMFEVRKHPVYQKYHHHFLGRVDDLSMSYHNARTVLLPVVEGHGIAVKAIEALSYGKRVLATPLAFRGFDRQLGQELTSEIANYDVEFRQRMYSSLHSGPPRSNPGAVEVYERLFAPEKQLEAYKKIILGG